MKFSLFLFALLFTFVFSKPNIVLIVIDDLGYGDLGAYGNTTVPTPNIDKMAKEGIKFNQMLAAESICTPSRSSMLTGRYPFRSGMASMTDAFRTLNSPAQPGGLPQSELSIAKLLKKEGYKTAAIGKWHLGIGKDNEHLPTSHGFDYFYGLPVTNVQTCAGKPIYSTVGGHGKILGSQNIFEWFFKRYLPIWTLIFISPFTLYFLNILSTRKTIQLYMMIILIFLFSVYYARLFTLLNPSSCLLYKNEEIIQQPVKLQNLTIQNLNEAKNFLKNSKDDPFFLYFAMVKVHTALFTSPKFENYSGKGAYIDNIIEMDYAIGKLMNYIKELKKDENTLFIFTSDNGPFVIRGIEAGSCGYVKNKEGKLMGPLSGAKGDQFECGIRVPGIMRWKGKLKEGIINDKTFSHLDFYPTIAKVANAKIPSSIHLDGKEMLSTIEKGNIDNHEYLMHYCGSNLVAARYKNYKVHFETPIYDKGEFNSCPSSLICSCSGIKRNPPLVFDLDIDPVEKQPLKYDDITKDIISKVNEEIKRHKQTIIPVENQLNHLPIPYLFPCCEKGKKLTPFEKYMKIFTNSCGCE
eukprot:gene2850-4693_t